MDKLNIASYKLKAAIIDLEQVKDVRVEGIVNNLKEEEENIDRLIMNKEDED